MNLTQRRFSREPNPLWRHRVTATRPSYIDGLTAWYDFSDPTTVFEDTSDLAENADTIASVTDKSGSGYTLTQSAANRRPTFLTDIRGDRSVGRFADDSNDDYLASSLGLAQPFTVLAAGEAGDTSHYRQLWEDAEGVCNGVLEQSTGKVSLYAGTELKGTSDVTGEWHVFVFVANGTSSKLYVDGALEASGDAGTNPIDGSGTFGSLQWGADHFDAGAWGGDIGEVLLYDSVLSTTDLNKAGRYLADRWGITWEAVA